MRPRSILSIAISGVASATALIPAASSATFPGTNGRIAFAGHAAGELAIASVHPDSR